MKKRFNYWTYQRCCEVGRKMQDFLNREQPNGIVDLATLIAYSTEDPLNPGQRFNLFNNDHRRRAYATGMYLKKLGVLKGDREPGGHRVTYWEVNPKYLKDTSEVVSRDVIVAARHSIAETSYRNALEVLEGLLNHNPDLTLRQTLSVIREMTYLEFFKIEDRWTAAKNVMENLKISYVQLTSGNNIECELKDVNLKQVYDLAVAQNSVIALTNKEENEKEENTTELDRNF